MYISSQLNLGVLAQGLHIKIGVNSISIGSCKGNPGRSKRAFPHLDRCLHTARAPSGSDKIVDRNKEHGPFLRWPLPWIQSIHTFYSVLRRCLNDG